MSGIILTTKEELTQILEKVFRQVLADKNLVDIQKPEPKREILTIIETSKFLNLAKPTLYTLTSKNKIPFFKRGKKLYFRRSELIEWIEVGRCKTIFEESKAVDSYLAKRGEEQ